MCVRVDDVVVVVVVVEDDENIKNESLSDVIYGQPLC